MTAQASNHYARRPTTFPQSLANLKIRHPPRLHVIQMTTQSANHYAQRLQVINIRQPSPVSVLTINARQQNDQSVNRYVAQSASVGSLLANSGNGLSPSMETNIPVNY